MSLDFVSLVESLPSRYGCRPVVVDALGELDAHTVQRAVVGLSERIETFGARVVASAADNGREALLLDLAVQCAGAVQLALPPYFTDAQRLHALDDAGAEHLLLDARLPGPPGWQRGGDWPEIASLAVWHRDRRASDIPAGTACITYTSGSTGAPKGLCLGADSLLRTAAALEQAFASLTLQRHLSVLPMSTLLEAVGLYAALLRGSSLHLPSLASLGYSGAAGLDPRQFAAAVDAERPDSVILVPQLLAALLLQWRNDVARSHRPQLLAVGGAKVPAALLALAEHLQVPVYEGYGLSEAGSVVALNRPDAHRPGSVGKPLSHIAVRIAEDGEVWLRGQSALPRPGAPALADAEGWWPTGDLGVLDAEGYLSLQGRKRNVFITAFGRNVSPEWIEAELAVLPGVGQVLVHGEALPANLALVCGDRATYDHAGGAQQLAAINARLPDYARIATLAWSAQAWTASGGLMTGNGRPRREAILAAHADVVREFEAAHSSMIEQGVEA